MKNANYLKVALAATMAGIFSACSDDLEKNMGKETPIVAGDEIMFGASDLATFGNGYSDLPPSRTVYGESTYRNGKWHYPLSWVYGDGISVYCPEAKERKFTHYRIEWKDGQKGDVQQNGNAAYMIKTGANGLHWGDTSKEHHFYAFYPSSAIQNDEAFANGMVHASIPNTQEVKWEQDAEGNWVGKPNMDYAFMRAYNVVTPENAASDRVTLEFTPLTTAIEVTLQASEKLTGGSVTLSQLQIQAINKEGSHRQTVCGDFTYNICTGVTSLGKPDVANDYMITVPCWHEENGKLVPIELTKGKTMTFTVFLLPRAEANSDDRTLHNLQVRVPGWNSTARVKTYEGINIAVGTKSQIWLPQYEPLDGANNWIEGLPENVYISQLSIPGSVNAFSHDIIRQYAYPGVGKDEMDLTQTLSVEDQFKIGVRAFEIATERAKSILDIDLNKKNLGTDGYLIAGTTLSSNLHTAMGRLADLVAANPSEFVIAMPYYAPDATDKGDAWSHQLQNYLRKLPTGANGHPVVKGVEIVPFDNSMTIKDSKGKILFLSRMPGGKEEVDRWVGTPQKTTAIYGWNSDKNRWEKRGYNMRASGYWSNGQWNGHGNPMEAGYTRPSYTAWKYEAATPLGNPNFYIQDWFRVCEKTGSYSYSLWKKQYWYESKTEKENNVKDFMNETIRVLKNDKTGNNVFINSLAGYYIVSKSDGVSAIPAPTTFYPNYGKHGDIPPFARDMNEVVYSYVLGLSYETRGPLGIVLINYAGAPQVFGMAMHGDYIVKALVDNNYRFELIGSQE